MPQPTEVNAAKFEVEKILYNTDGFSIAFGVWEDGKMYLGIRWDGENDKTGFPQTFGKPQWLVVAHELTIPFTKALLDSELETDKKEISDLLTALYELQP